MPTSPLAMEIAFPLSKDSTAANRSIFFSTKSASLTRSFPLFSGVSCLHGPSNALRAAATATSTSFSVASCTEQMTFSVDGLITSKVLPSIPFTHSLLMNLYDISNCLIRSQEVRLLQDHNGPRKQLHSRQTTRAGSKHLQTSRLLIFASERRLNVLGSHN